MRFRKIFIRLLSFLLSIQTLYHYIGFELLRFLVYAVELTFIFLSLIVVVQQVNRLSGKFIYLSLLALVLLFSFQLNGKSEIDDIFKILGGTVIFLASYYLFNNRVDIGKTEKREVVFVAVLPLVVFLIDSYIGFQENLNAMSIFSNSNNYIFFSLCCLWLMMVYKIPKKIIWGYLAVSFAVTSTLGAFLGITVATAFYFRRKIFIPKFFLLFSVFIMAVAALVLYSDLYLFDRIRGTATVFYTLFTNYSITEFSSIGFGEAMSLSGSSDGSDTSFLFRIKLWTESLLYFLDQSFFYLLFGLGFGSIPDINSFGLVAHNDYLTWFIETGIIGFFFIVFGIWSGFVKLKNTRYIIPYLGILIYFFSENLFYNFFAIMLFAFCLATSLQNTNNENTTDKQLPSY